MRTVYYLDYRSSSSPRLAEACRRGFGWDICDDFTIRSGNIAMFGQPNLWKVLMQARMEGRTWWYLDHGYFHRGSYFAITRDAFKHDGRGNAGPERFKALRMPFRPWRPRHKGRHIIVCPPTEEFEHLMIDAGVYPAGPGRWVDRIVDELRRFTDRPIRVRDRSEMTEKHRGLKEDLGGAWALVAGMSNTAVEALLFGVPVFVLAPGAARRMGCPDLSRIENPEYPAGREQFVWNLAANQWTLGEIAAGAPRRILRI